ncbi:MAG: hypothetical protein ACXWFX_15990, partial [Methylobacter sp.]
MVLLFSDCLQCGSKSNVSKSRYLVSCLMVLLGGIASSKSYAVASPDDTIKPYVAASLLYDSNFLRLSDNVDPVSVTGKSD